MCLSFDACMAQPSVVGGEALWAGGLTIPWTGAQAARDFPQGTPATSGLSLGLTTGNTAPTLATQFLSLGIHRRFRVFHASVLGNVSGDMLYSELGIGLRGGLSTPRWGMGLGVDANTRQIAGQGRAWPTLCAGLSLYWNPRTSLHIRSSFMARQSLEDPLIVDGFASAWLIDHKIGRTRLMGFIQQWETRGWDTGLACLIALKPRWEASACGSVVGQRFSMGLHGSFKNWGIAASAMISALPIPGSLYSLQFATANRSP